MVYNRILLVSRYSSSLLYKRIQGFGKNVSKTLLPSLWREWNFAGRSIRIWLTSVARAAAKHASAAKLWANQEQKMSVFDMKICVTFKFWTHTLSTQPTSTPVYFIDVVWSHGVRFSWKWLCSTLFVYWIAVFTRNNIKSIKNISSHLHLIRTLAICIFDQISLS